MFITTLFTNFPMFMLIFLAVIPAVCLHEYFHAQVALWCGDPTAAQHGHLTLNPLKQIGTWPLIIFLLIGITWGAVPVNPNNLTRRGRVLTALAGPCVNFVLFVIGVLLASSLIYFRAQVPVLLFRYAEVLAYYNLILFLFNILPIPGLDGWNVLVQFVRIRNASSEFFKGAMIFMILALIVGFNYIANAAYKVIQYSILFLSGMAG